MRNAHLYKSIDFTPFHILTITNNYKMSSRFTICFVLAALLLAFVTSANIGDDDRRLRECSKGCEQQQQQQQQQKCQRVCLHKYGRERERESQRGEGRREREEYSSPNPYVFEDRHFITGIKSQYGQLRILQKFTESSELLRGIENFRVAIFETQPQTFLVPSHWDAETLVFVANGRGTFSMVQDDRRESFSIKEGDLFRIRSGTTSYLVNEDNNERLVLAKLYLPVNTPGQFEVFFGTGGENAESYLKAFSNEILEAAFNVKSDKLRRLLGQQKQGAIIKASEEQIRALSHHQEGGAMPFRRESKDTHSLYNQRPTFNNDFGRYYEVDSTKFRQLRDLNIAVSIANISEGAMSAPYYNSKATEINIVVDGEGYFEMASPPQSRRSGEEFHESQRERRGYQTVRSRLRVGTVVVVPAGHPVAVVASSNQNLQILSFKVNADDNEQFTLAGKRSVMEQLEREAKELTFGIPAREVDEVLKSQQEEIFVRGPRQQREGRSDE